jgi:hypothetical protein
MNFTKEQGVAVVPVRFAAQIAIEPVLISFHIRLIFSSNPEATA